MGDEPAEEVVGELRLAEAARVVGVEERVVAVAVPEREVDVLPLPVSSEKGLGMCVAIAPYRRATWRSSS